MDKDRRGALIIGNGFDLRLGRKTSYKDFCQFEFCPKGYPSPLIKYLNNKWNDNSDAVKWYDLGNKLYNYYIRVKGNSGQIVDLCNDKEKNVLEQIQANGPVTNSYEYIESNVDIVNNLLKSRILILPRFSCYISFSHEDMLDPPIERDQKALQLIKNGLIQYLIKVQQETVNENSIATIVAKAFIQSKSDDQIVIYSFNYTSFSEVAPNSSFAMEFNDTINYVHGCILDRNITLGTEDEKVIYNYGFIQKSFDSQYNPPVTVYDLTDADDIAIFGHLLGIDDSQYFKALSEGQSSLTNPQKKNITVFTKDAKSKIEIRRSLQKMTNWSLTSLYGLSNLQIIKTDECTNSPALLRKYIKMYTDNEEDIDGTIHI